LDRRAGPLFTSFPWKRSYLDEARFSTKKSPVIKIHTHAFNKLNLNPLTLALSPTGERDGVRGEFRGCQICLCIHLENRSETGIINAKRFI